MQAAEPGPESMEIPADRRVHGVAAALDVGRARIGVAIADRRGLHCRPLEVVHRKGTRRDIAAIRRLLAHHGVGVWIVGLPPANAGSDDMSRLARAFAGRLAAVSEQPVFLVDEAETTAEARAELRALGLRHARRRKVIDKVAAARILDRWLRGDEAELVPATPRQPPPDGTPGQ